MSLDKLGLAILAVAGAAWLYAILSEPGTTPAVQLALVATVTGFGLLVAKAVRDRAASAEDDHYSRTVEK